MDSYLAAIRSATSNEEVVKIIYNSIESPELYTFSEMLAENLVKSLADSPENVKFYHLLLLFAYGTYEQYLTEKNKLPDLSPGMTLKLRQLTLVSMSMQNKQIPVKQAMASLKVNSIHELQAIFIGAVYAGIIQGKWNTEKELIEVQSWRNRDVQPDGLDTIKTHLAKWIEYCSTAAEGLENIVANAEKAIADAEANEARVEEEIKRIRKTMQEQDDESRTKEMRKLKMSRTQKFS